MDAAFNYKVRNAHYHEVNEISDVVASRDLKRMCEVGLLIPMGEKRGRYCVGNNPLKKSENSAQIERGLPIDMTSLRRKSAPRSYLCPFRAGSV
jgi:hypothetical protein